LRQPQKMVGEGLQGQRKSNPSCLYIKIENMDFHWSFSLNRYVVWWGSNGLAKYRNRSRGNGCRGRLDNFFQSLFRKQTWWLTTEKSFFMRLPDTLEHAEEMES
ncbi:MAG: hypothetical protein VX990_02580, partial [Pseudomonadota bacterium]|nr:hypothetical protein [Pseudomonadota bacterium]